MSSLYLYFGGHARDCEHEHGHVSVCEFVHEHELPSSYSCTSENQVFFASNLDGDEGGDHRQTSLRSYICHVASCIFLSGRLQTLSMITSLKTAVQFLRGLHY